MHAFTGVGQVDTRETGNMADFCQLSLFSKIVKELSHIIQDSTDYGCENSEKARTGLETSFLLGSIWSAGGF